MNCVRHPQRRAVAICQKFSQGYCEECRTCSDPKGYCKFRTQCVGWQVCRERKEDRKEKRTPS